MDSRLVFRPRSRFDEARGDPDWQVVRTDWTWCVRLS